MSVSHEQLRAGRALLHIDQAELARRAGVSPVTIRRIESGNGVPRVSPATLESVQHALEMAGAEFIPFGVRRRVDDADREALFRDLQVISKASAAALPLGDSMTEADLYGEDGLPA
jgi:transcriptional regulator with XRE-family HTH domain